MSGAGDPLATLRQSWPTPTRPRPVVVFGAGGIVRDAHLPGYRKAGFTVSGLFDPDAERARDLAAAWSIPRVYRSIAEAAAEPRAVFDLAIPPAAHPAVLDLLPAGATVLIQKPMGEDLDAATEILRTCRRKRLVAAVNFQLRFAPMMLALRDAIDRSLLGRIVDLEVHLNLLTPWDMFPFLRGLGRVELPLHSIHYLDLIRSLLGDPVGVHAHTLGHPRSGTAQTRSSAILRFADPDLRCTLSVNHDHRWGRRLQDAAIRVEGTDGAARATLGLLLDYPRGEPDELLIASGPAGEWQRVALAGTWFPDAFGARMASLQRFAAGEDATLPGAVEDAWRTMALVEAAFRSSAAPATAIDAAPND